VESPDWKLATERRPASKAEKTKARGTDMGVKGFTCSLLTPLWFKMFRGKVDAGFDAKESPVFGPLLAAIGRESL
jgi:hypothetical protein